MTRSIFSVAFILGLMIYTQAQETENGRIEIEITKEINGEKKTFKGSYENEAQMLADPNYQEFAEEGNDSWFNFSTDDEDIAIFLDQIRDTNHSYFKFFGDEDQDAFFFNHFDDDSSTFSFNLDIAQLQKNLKDLGVDTDVMINQFKHPSAAGSRSITISKVEDNEFGKKGNVNSASLLKMEDLSITPDFVNNGKVKIRFTVPEEGELSIKISNQSEKDVFTRYFERFGGTYSESIDLAGQLAGTYLLEISLNKKRMVRKLVVN